MLVEGVLFIAAALGIAYLVLQLTGASPSYQGASALYKLSVPDQVVLPNASCPWTNSPWTLRFAIYVEQAPRTISNIDCIHDKTSTSTDSYSSYATSFAPSCSDYSYKPCSCSVSECSKCAVSSKGNLSKLLYIADNLEFWASGYTSQNDKPYIPALLKIRTGDSTAKHFMEAVPLPALPLQKWTVVTIVKEGRRFDVYYGAKSMISHLCNHIPVAPANTDDWHAGNKVWKGQIGLFTGTPTSRTSDEVEADVSALVNTRGIPNYLEQINFNFDVTMPQCMFGNCNSLPTVKPKNPFAAYESHVQ